MEVYDDEEQQLEALKRWWKENGLATVIGIITGIVAIVGWQLWQNYQQQKLLVASQGYEQLQKTLAENNLTEALIQADQLLNVARTHRISAIPSCTRR